MAEALFHAVLRACDDPGSITKREENEGLPHWQARAVIESIGSERAVYVLAVGHALDSRDAERIQFAVMQALREEATMPP